MRWAWNQPLSPLEKLVLLALAEATDENGVSSPSISVLAIQCQLSSRTVQRAINALLNVGLLERTRRQRDDGASISSQYRLKVQGDDPWSGGHRSVKSEGSVRQARWGVT